MATGVSAGTAGRAKVVLFVDWDETISSHDTLALIAPQDDEHDGAPFSTYGEAYMADLHAYDAAWRQRREDGDVGEEGTTIPRPWLAKQNPAWRARWAYLRDIDSVELESQRRIEEGKLFVGFDAAAMERRAASERVQLRAGWPAFARQHLERTEWHVISVGWSARFIATALLSHGTSERAMPTSICANEVEVDAATRRGTGRLTKSRDAQQGGSGIRTGAHKVREMRRVMADRHRGDGGAKSVTLYVGDSPTDLPCLVEADVGVIMGGKGSLQKTLDEVGLDVVKTIDDSAIARVKERIHRVCTGVDCLPPFLIAVADWTEADRVVSAVCEAAGSDVL